MGLLSVERDARLESDPFTPEDGCEDPPKLPMPKGLRMRKRWFWNRNCTTFTKWLSPLAGRQLKFLDIGIFEGAAEAWLLEHVLTHPQSQVIGLDPWMPTHKQDGEFMEQAFENAKYNLGLVGGRKWRLVRGYSRYLLQGMPCWPYKERNNHDKGTVLPDFGAQSFDVVIVDGDHDREPVKRDAELCLPLLKVGGWMIFDDVRNKIPKTDHVADGIQDFLALHGDKVKLVWRHRFMDCYERVA